MTAQQQRIPRIVRDIARRYDAARHRAAVAATYACDWEGEPTPSYAEWMKTTDVANAMSVVTDYELNAIAGSSEYNKTTRRAALTLLERLRGGAHYLLSE